MADIIEWKPQAGLPQHFTNWVKDNEDLLDEIVAIYLEALETEDKRYGRIFGD